MPLAYSYIRFSSARQAKGGSLERQVEKRDKWLAEHPEVTLVREYRDLRISATGGRNTVFGTFSTFLELVTSGKIAPGSYLIVENLDRITRDELIEAVFLIIGLIRAGIVILTVMDNMIYQREEDGARQLLSLMFSLVILSRAAEESHSRTDRTQREAAKRRKAAIETGQPMGAGCRAWLTYDRDRKVYVPDAGACATVKRMFTECANGAGHGLITQRLIKEGVKPFGRSGRWNTAYVRNILLSRSVLGELELTHRSIATDYKTVKTGEGHEKYYPAIIDRDLWDRAQLAYQNRGKGKVKQRNGMTTNLFAGLCKCLECDGPMVAHVGRKPQYYYLRCRNANRGHACKNTAQFRYDRLEAAILNEIKGFGFNAAELVRDGDTTQLDKNLANLKAERGKIEKRIGRYRADLEDEEHPATRKQILGWIGGLNDDQARLHCEIETAENERMRTVATAATDSVAAIRTMLAQINDTDTDIREKARQRVAVGLREICDGVAFGSDGIVTASFAGYFLQVKCKVTKRDKQQQYHTSLHMNNPFGNVTYILGHDTLNALPLDKNVGTMVSHTLCTHDVQQFLDRLAAWLIRYATDPSSGRGSFPQAVVDAVQGTVQTEL